jgi:lipopolysaccharide/colanic/teichoic acid biosynthesis glycosyltransferase
MIHILSTVVPVRVFTLFISEIVLLYACFLAPAFFDPDVGDIRLFLLYEAGILRISIVVGMVVLGLFLRNLYAEVRIPSRLSFFQNLCIIFGLVFIGQGLIGYLNTQWIVPRKMMLPGTVLAVAVIFGWRLLFDNAVRNMVAAGRVLFIGMSPTVAKIAGHFAAYPELGLTAIGYLESGTPAASAPITRLGTMADLEGVVDRTVLDSIVIGNRDDIRPWWTDEFLELRFRGVRVEEAGTLYERIFARRGVTEILPSKVIFQSAPDSGSIVIDPQSLYSWAIALAAAIVTLPFTLTLAALIKIGSRGPVLVRETRVGLHEAPFEMYRFRCVRLSGRDGARTSTGEEDDPQMYTSIGRFLRHHGFVWLPLLLNVLKGQMAMVGPRPERPLFARRMNELIPFYPLRHGVKPGVTGWARIHRRAGDPQDSLRDLEYDLYYLENHSLILDFFIMLLALRAATRSDGSAI